jgi:hypothetical protein
MLSTVRSPAEWRHHVASTPIGSVPVAVEGRNGPVLAYRVFFGPPDALLRAFGIAAPDEQFWPAWLRESAAAIRKART